MMAITSNSFSVKTLGTGWRVIHKIGLYGIFVGFFSTYLGRIQSHGTYESDIVGDLWLYMVLFMLVIRTWLLRLVAFWLKPSIPKSVQEECGRCPWKTCMNRDTFARIYQRGVRENDRYCG